MLDTITGALSRRRMLMGLALSATAATVADASTGPQENPDLLALADAFPVVLAEYVAARDRKKSIIAEWSHRLPVPDQEIICYGNGCREYRGLDGRMIKVPRFKPGILWEVSIGTPEHFEASAAQHEKEAARCAAFKSQRKVKSNLLWAERERERIEPARAFLSEYDGIIAASGIETANARATKALDALKSAVDQIMVADDRTITGAVIKAQALNAWAEADDWNRHFNLRGPAWADLMAASIMKHAATA